ncbi:hypothetical protein BMS3Abin15_00166 [bacterium BMS3Abin15]|nr:hypothetical protein BMS3Abin15_00166 [bacterium BMS3Abin15]HDZ85213.1 hypothetical protein [Candidatus Moranbacteria bacterium]
MHNVLSLFHHIHHEGEDHKVHHCGGRHVKTDPLVDYTIEHCSCGKHSINKEYTTGHITDNNLESKEIKVRFAEKCPNGGWHIESGIADR